MSERLSNESKELHHKPHVESTSYHEAEQQNKEHEERKKSLESLESIRKKVEQQATTRESAKIEKNTDEPSATPRLITKHIKMERYKSTLSHVRRSLSPAQRIMSKLIHQPTIETISEVGAKTVARPSGLLGGSLVALMGSLSVIIVAKRIGFEVPNSIFWVLFLTGFLAGIVIEVFIKYFKKTKKS